MWHSTRLTIAIVVASTALVASATAAAARPASDASKFWGATFQGPVANPNPSTQNRERRTAIHVKGPGPRFWGMTFQGPVGNARGSVAATGASRSLPPESPGLESRGGFDWAAAGVGAAGMLGIALIVAGVGAALALRGRAHAYGKA